MITQKELKRLLHYNQETGLFHWLVDIGVNAKRGTVAGTLSSKGYVRIGISGKYYNAHRLAWLYEYGYLPEGQIDHKNRVRNDNWIDNLREASPTCQMQNRTRLKSNKSGLTGICYRSDHNKWRVRITVNYKLKNIGNFDTYIEAACHRLAAEQCLGWARCREVSESAAYVKNNITSHVNLHRQPRA